MVFAIFKMQNQTSCTDWIDTHYLRKLNEKSKVQVDCTKRKELLFNLRHVLCMCNEQEIYFCLMHSASWHKYIVRFTKKEGNNNFICKMHLLDLATKDVKSQGHPSVPWPWQNSNSWCPDGVRKVVNFIFTIASVARKFLQKYM